MRLTKEQKRRIVIVKYQTELVDTVKEVFTKEQRREVYLRIADIFRKNPDYDKFMSNKKLFSEFLCDNFMEQLFIVTGYIFWDLNFHQVFPIFFPEFVLFKPKKKSNMHLGWWKDDSDEGLAIRADVMTLCAEMCK